MSILIFLVLIVPLWNWNFGSRIFLIVSYGINCTVVELKPGKQSHLYNQQMVLIVPLWNWNRLRRGNIRRKSIVLIVPLWNWNIIYTERKDGVLPGINCTVVELKHNMHCKPENSHTCINCTVVELKPSHKITISGRRRSINCTVVELKQGIHTRVSVTLRVLIVPLWNWNTVNSEE